jgi:hypothetical protein
LVVPKTKKAVSDAVTPGINKTMSEIVFEIEKLGAPEAAIEALLLAWNRVKTMMAISKTLPVVSGNKH